MRRTWLILELVDLLHGCVDIGPQWVIPVADVLFELFPWQITVVELESNHIAWYAHIVVRKEFIGV